MELSPRQRIREWRKLKGWTYRQLSDASGILISKLHKLEHDKQEVKAADMEVIAEALGLTMAEFYGDFGDSKATAANG